MIELTVEQRRAVAESGPNPQRVVDPDTNTTYVLIPEDTYDRVKAFVLVDNESEALGEIYAHVMEVFGREGWDDPSMDVYDDLDPRRRP